ncbi:sulfur carrier protein ThiS [Pelotomaculum isophthalicicum JI]|uniref:Sulfur carrier protein ThiS n=1 Tax=Pelotomaculum isophthalicicum JI TaxID=947010 RepID=A0A9X4JVL9_9FIRM|nr:sulfur carrier protein ThiS [Pelotomaculum isophthalicicum]MDF9407663.1 sulfur carrier protein ThiS [Pelotomaculum isophthalicicum JI]
MIEKGQYEVIITLNGEKELLSKEYTVIELVKEYGLNPEMVTVGLNGAILFREAFESTIIKSGDSVNLLFTDAGK